MILYALPITIVIYMELLFLHTFFNICFVTDVKFSEVLPSVGFCYIIISSSNATCFLQDITDTSHYNNNHLVIHFNNLHLTL